MTAATVDPFFLNRPEAPAASKRLMPGKNGRRVGDDDLSVASWMGNWGRGTKI
jgi:hypothetical protein